jgi:16S rRNA (adenine1518-N6/adenine1519-N6)-dimethyltransferase
MSRQRLGQHFLVRDAVLERLAKAACGEHTERIVEIGPGRGALTRHLLPHTDELHAIELDTGLVKHLQAKFAGEPKVTVHQGNVLETDLEQWGPAVVTGNLPYYITSPIIERFVGMDARFPLAVFLMQWEVAERLLANPGTRSYGYLTVATKLVCDAELVTKIPPSAFIPPPKVDSAAVLLLRKPDAPEDLEAILQFAGRCFAHKRKTLRNNLRGFYGDRIDIQPEANLRAEQMPIGQFIDLYQRLERFVN